MATLIIPDVHEQVEKLPAIEKLAEQAERVVFVGDFFDSYVGNRAGETARWVKEHIQTPHWTFLLGNHDCHYAFKNPGFRCSGYAWQKKDTIERILTVDDWRRFQVFTRVGPFVVSHAGFCPKTKKFLSEDVAQQALDLAFAGSFHPLFDAGYARGGRAPLGGPTWLDWNAEFRGIPGVPQIVGHTNGKEVRTNGDNWCIDNGLRSVVWVDGLSVREEML